MPRFFAQREAFSDKTVTISGEDALHISRALRMKKGEPLTVSDGAGIDFDCEISEIAQKTVLLNILRSYPSPSEAAVEITLYQGVPKAGKLDYIVQKATEIGVARIVPVLTRRCVGVLEKDAKLDRLRKIALEAAKQSNRAAVPEVTAQISFSQAVERLKTADLALIPYEAAGQPPAKDAIRSKAAPKTAAILIGPEGGFEESEVCAARAAGALPLTLGRRILRTETAGLVAAAILLYELDGMV